MSHRLISAAGLAFIKRWEGLVLHCYLCSAGKETIGYGSTGPHVREGMTITKAEAEALLLKDLERFERGVELLVPKLSQHRFDALVSLAFNVGLANLTGSTLVRKLKAGDYRGAAEQFDVWRMITVTVNKKPRKVISQGLVSRRAAERRMFEGVP